MLGICRTQPHRAEGFDFLWGFCRASGLLLLFFLEGLDVGSEGSWRLLGSCDRPLSKGAIKKDPHPQVISGDLNFEKWPF